MLEYWKALSVRESVEKKDKVRMRRTIMKTGGTASLPFEDESKVGYQSPSGMETSAAWIQQNRKPSRVDSPTSHCFSMAVTMAYVCNTGGRIAHTFKHMP